MRAIADSEYLQKFLNQPVGDIEEEKIACEVCGDLGVVRYSVPVDDPRFGKLFPCPASCEKAVERQRQRVELVMRSSTWGNEYNSWTFETFRELPLDEKLGGLAAALYFAEHAGEMFDLHQASWRSYGHDWPKLQDARPKMNVVLAGETGLGKTGLAVAATNTLRERGVPVVFYRVRDLIEDIQRAYSQDKANGKSESEMALGSTAAERKSFFASVPVLILDEFNLENYSPDRLEIIETIIRHRDRDNLPFLATTNIATVDEFKMRWRERIGDVVAKAHWVGVWGEKLRVTSRTVEVF